MMQLDQSGLDLIKRWEGYHRKVKGSTDCKAYLCSAGVPTIGYGCTKGVRLGMRWTKKKAEQEFKKELAGHEAFVSKVVKVPLSQWEQNALISFAYNCGNGALQRSTLLKVVNRGEKDKVPSQFLRWTKHRNPKTGGMMTSRGLLNRRMDEIKMWRGEYHQEDNSTPESETMPQSVEPEVFETKRAAKSSKTVTGGLVALFGGVFSYAAESVQWLVDVATETTGLSQISSVLAPIGVDLKTIGLIIVFAGAAIVIHRKLSDSKEGVS